MAAMPVGDAARIGEERAVGTRQQRADAAQIGELDRVASPQRRQRQVERGEVDREIGAVRDHTEQYGLALRRDLLAREQGCPRRSSVADMDEVLAPPDRHEAARRIGQALGEPSRLLAAMTGSIDHGVGVEIGLFHFRPTVAQSHATGQGRPCSAARST
jgi:hypothetical protein